MNEKSLQSWYFQKIEDAKDIFAIANALIIEKGIDLKQDYSKELLQHSEEVARLSIVVGDIFRVSYQEKIDLAMGALLHDYGKTQIDPNILYKKGTLTEMEYLLVQNHPSIGYRLLREHNFSDAVLRIVLMHHEKLDGKGYPLGEKNPDFLVQIVTLADMFDAIYTKRSYHEARSVLETIDIIGQEKGINPVIIDKVKKTASVFKE